MSSTLRLASLPFLLTSVVAAPASIWHISILESPAPPPDEGPPLSAGALRDKSKLKYEIIGIVGAYIVWLLCALFLIFFVGKRLRRKAQTSNRTLSMEMMKSNGATAYQVPSGPKSPGKMASLKSWATGGKHSYKQSDVTVSSIDEKIVDSDRQRNLDDMTNLYAAVIAHDEEKSQKARNSSASSPTSPRQAFAAVNHTQSAQAMPTPPMSPQYPPEFQHLRSAVAQAQTDARALAHAQATAPASAENHSTSTSRASTKKGTPLSFISGKHDRSGSSNSTKPRPSHISVRGMPISQPIGSADITQSSQYSEDRPLSPRLYNPGPPPPTPGQSKPHATTQTYEVDGPRRRTPGEQSLYGKTATNSSTNTLPFRDMYGIQDGMRTAPPTKTTFVNARETMGIHPKTGVPATPYSPYTPFTPMTPITPRLMTKKEMKKKRKEDGMGVLSEDDMVVSDQDMWGS